MTAEHIGPIHRERPRPIASRIGPGRSSRCHLVRLSRLKTGHAFRQHSAVQRGRLRKRPRCSPNLRSPKTHHRPDGRPVMGLIVLRSSFARAMTQADDYRQCKNVTRSAFSSGESLVPSTRLKNSTVSSQGQQPVVVIIGRRILDAAERKRLDRSVRRSTFALDVPLIKPLGAQVVHEVIRVVRRDVTHGALSPCPKKGSYPSVLRPAFGRIESAKMFELWAGGKSSRFWNRAIGCTWLPRSSGLTPFLVRSRVCRHRNTRLAARTR